MRNFLKIIFKFFTSNIYEEKRERERERERKENTINRLQMVYRDTLFLGKFSKMSRENALFR